QAAVSSVTVSYSSVQSAGNLNVVVVGWNDSTARVQSVTDLRGNSYILAVGPTVSSGFGSQAIYYGKSILGGSNTVTVTFDRSANHPDIRIAEYSGLDRTAPLDVVAAAQGSSSSTSSGSVTTTNPS